MSRADDQHEILTNYGKPSAMGQDGSDLDRAVEKIQRLASLGSIAASVAHEINNILTPIISYAHMALAEEPESEIVRKALEQVDHGG